MTTLEAIYGVPDDEPVVQLFVPAGGQCGEIRWRGSRLEITLWPPGGQSPWTVDAAELGHAIDEARRVLIGGE